MIDHEALALEATKAKLKQIADAAQRVLDNDGGRGSKCFSAVALADAREELRLAIAAGACEALDAYTRKIRAKAFEDAIAIARGCQIEYGGGYREQREEDAFHHGMQTVETCLRGRADGANLQAAIAEAIGRRELSRAAKIEAAKLELAAKLENQGREGRG